MNGPARADLRLHGLSTIGDIHNCDPGSRLDLRRTHRGCQDDGTAEKSRDETHIPILYTRVTCMANTCQIRGRDMVGLATGRPCEPQVVVERGARECPDARLVAV